MTLERWAPRALSFSNAVLICICWCALPIVAFPAPQPVVQNVIQTPSDSESKGLPEVRKEETQENGRLDEEKPAEEELEKALEEFRIQAERVSSSNLEPSSKVSSRTKDYHGNLYEYVRNEAFDALPHQVRQAGESKSVLRRNQFGFNLSGPLWIPKLLKKRESTFFSVTYEGTREKIARSRLFNISTTQEQQGDFSDLVDNAGEPITIYDPATTRPNPQFNPQEPVSTTNLQYLRDPFPGNTIPKNRMDPVALNTLPYYPSPNTDVGPFLRNNYFVNAAEINKPNGIVLKIDHSQGQKHKMTFSAGSSSGLREAAPIFNNIANPGTPPRLISSREASFVETFNISPTLINQFSMSANYNSRALAENTSQIDYASELGLTGVQAGAFPRFDLSDYVSIGSQPGSLVHDQTADYSFSENLSIRYKKHNLKLNFTSFWGQVNSYLPENPSGQFQFDGKLTGLPGINNTGNSFAQFLLGWVSQAGQSIVPQPSYFRSNEYQLILSDEYQITPNFSLTATIGLQIDTPRREKYDQQSTIDLSVLNPANDKPGALVFAGINGVSNTFSHTQYNWEPALGFTWNPWGSRRTVIRAGYSLNYSYFPLYPTVFGTLGFNASPVLVSPNDQLAPATTLQEGYPQNFVYPPDLLPTAANGLQADYVDPSGTLPYEQHWSLEVERDLPADFVVRAAYDGQRGVHQYTGGGVELSPIDPVNLSYQDRLYNLQFNLSLRPYPQFLSLTPGWPYPIGSSTTHRGLFRFEKRFSHGLNFSGSYTLSKTLQDVLWGAHPQNSLDLKPEKAIAPYDITHQLAFNFLYELPFGEGRTYVTQGGWIGEIVGGWSLSGVTTLRSGTPIDLVPLFNNTGNVTQSLRVNVVPGISAHVQNPTPSQWFNAAAFIQPSDFTLGDGPRTHPSLRNPGFQNLDLSLNKRISVTDDWTMELVVEAFNAFNHGNWNYPDPVIGSLENPNLNAGHIIGSTGGRVVQIGLRFSF